MTKTRLQGWQYEAQNVCAECQGKLRDAAGQYHTRGVPWCEPVCCACAGHKVAKATAKAQP